MAFKADINPAQDGQYSLGDTKNSKIWKVNGHESGYIELTVELKSQDGQTLVISDSRITSNHVVINTISQGLVGYILTPVE